ncbi:MAG: hypothetical protein MZW92_31240 [Comamonadaceae bacterium]|nr:hypothetical protein [Comamonadaceae bacterium]
MVFIDEAHELNASAQNALLTITEAPYRARFNNAYIDFRHVCFVLATTDSSRLVKPLRTRVTSVTFQSYGLPSLMRIVQRKYPHINDATAERIVYAGRLIPRTALQIASLLRPGNEETDLQTMFNIDENGLDGRDRQIIQVLQSNFVQVDPLKIAQANHLIQMFEADARVSPNQVAAARALLNTPNRYKPLVLKLFPTS